MVNIERDIERYLRLSARDLGGYAWKWVSPGIDGVPDRIVMLPRGVICFAELKDAGRVPSRKQLLRHEQLRSLGFNVFIPDSRLEVDRMLAEVTHGI